MSERNRRNFSASTAGVLPPANSSDTACDIALKYLRSGWQPVPVPYQQKGPNLRDWPNLAITGATVSDYFDHRRQNIGVQMGARSGGLTDVDLDSPEALALASTVLPPTRAVFGRHSKPGSHRLYVTDLHASEQKATIQFVEPAVLSKGQRAMLVELRVGGGDSGAPTIFPGSTHPSGEVVRWDSEGGPATVDGSVLMKAVAALAAATLLVRHYPAEGQRHEAALVLGGALARNPDNKADEIKKFVSAVAQCAGDEEAEDRGRSAASAVELLTGGRHTPGLPRMREVWGVELTDTFAKWLELGEGDPVGRGKSKADNQTNLLIALADVAELFHSPEGATYADVEVNGHRETLLITSKNSNSGFGAWLRHRFYEEDRRRAQFRSAARCAKYPGGAS